MTTHDDKQDTSLKISQYVHLYIKTYQVLKDDVIMFFSTFFLIHQQILHISFIAADEFYTVRPDI